MASNVIMAKQSFVIIIISKTTEIDTVDTTKFV